MKVLKIVLFSLVLIYIVLNLAGCLTFRMSDKKRLKYFREANPSVRFDYTLFPDKDLFYAETTNDSAGIFILFIHGSPGSGSNFYSYLKDSRLTSKAQLGSIDRPGFGHSHFGESEPLLSRQAERISPLLMKHRHQRIILCGHSLGAPVAVKTAIQYPKWVQGVFILAGSVDPRLEPKEPWRKPMDHSLLSWMMPKSFRVSNREILPLKKQLEEMIPEWKQIMCPVYVLQGGKDKLVHPDNAAFVASMLPESQRIIVKIPDENHFIPFSNAPLLNQHLLNFIQPYGKEQKEK